MKGYIVELRQVKSFQEVVSISSSLILALDNTKTYPKVKKYAFFMYKVRIFKDHLKACKCETEQWLGMVA